MKSWLKLSSLVATLALLAACSSGLQTDAPDEEPSLATQATTVTKTVPNAVSDAEEQSSGPYYSDSTVLDLGEKSEPQQTGLRFTGINIPKGATITSAKLEFVAVTDTSRSTSLTVRGDKEANAPEFTSSYPQISARPKTTAVTNWVPGAWTSGNTYSTVDFRSVVQELVNQSSWASGNAMAFIIAGSGQRKAQSYDGNSTKAAKLIVTYDVASPPSTSCLQGASHIDTISPTGRQYYVKGKDLNARVSATGKTFTVRPNSSGGVSVLTVQDNKSNLCLSGGKFGTGESDSLQWADPGYHNDFAITVVNSPNVILENIAIQQTGDAFSFKSYRGNANNWTIRDSYVRHAGDDFVENDPKYNGLIDDVLADWAYMGISCRGDRNSSLNPPGTVTVQDSLIALKKQVGTSGGLKPNDPNHLFMFKFEQDSKPNCKLRLKNTVFYMQLSNDVFRSTQSPIDYVTECSNVTLVYVGSGDYNANNKTSAGRLAALRSKFGPDCFKLVQGSTATSFWQQKRAAWFDRHSGNSQIFSYKNLKEPGVN